MSAPVVMQETAGLCSTFELPPIAQDEHGHQLGFAQ